MIKVKCKCGKRAFPSDKDARRFAHANKISFGYAYQCPINGTYHLTTMSGKVTIRKSFGGAGWEICNGKSTHREETFEAARKRGIKWAKSYKKQYGAFNRAVPPVLEGILR